MLRIVHTSDWHLGHTLHGVSREAEHAAFLRWLEELVVAERADALLVTGDVFDTATPPASAERALYDLLARLRARAPGLGVVITGGNHDGPARLEAPAALLEALGVRVVASLGRPSDPTRCVLPLRDASGAVAAWVAAVPFLRPADLPAARPGDGPGLDRAVVEVHRAAVAHARALRAPGQALLATGHLAVRGAAVSADSERRVLGGAAPDAGELFAPDLAYVALGHLHRAQAVGREAVRYAGSPLPLSLAEADHAHQVVLVELEGERLARVEPRLVPRTVDVLRLPRAGPGPEAALLAELARLPDDHPALVEARVAAPAPDPGLRRRVEEALRGKAARLVKLTVAGPAPADARALAESAPSQGLLDLSPREVLVRCWRREREADPPVEVLEAIDELLATTGPAAAEPADLDGSGVAARAGGAAVEDAR